MLFSDFQERERGRGGGGIKIFVNAACDLLAPTALSPMESMQQGKNAELFIHAKKQKRRKGFRCMVSQ